MNKSIKQVAKHVLATCFILFNFSALSQTCITLVDSVTREVVPYAYASISGNHKTYISDWKGRLCSSFQPDDQLTVNAFSYQEHSLKYQVGMDTILLVLDSQILKDVDVIDSDRNSYFLKDKSKRKSFQCPPAGIVARKLHSDCETYIDSISVYVKSVEKESNILRVVAISPDYKIIAKSPPVSIPANISGEYINIPTGFFKTFNDTFYIGIEFLEKEIKPTDFRSKHYGNRPRKGLISNQSNGITLGAYKMKDEEEKDLRLYGSFIGAHQNWRKGMVFSWALYLGVYYDSECGLSSEM